MESLTKIQQELYDWLIEYMGENQHSPSIRQMADAMGLKSQSPIQYRLAQLRKKGYIDWSGGKARTIRLLQVNQGIPVLGAIVAGYASTVHTDHPVETAERFDFTGLSLKPGDYALRVQGDSMIDAMIGNGDIVIMRPVPDPQRVRAGKIVAALVEDSTTLKYFHRVGDRIQLKPANSNYHVQEFAASQVKLQGQLIGVWRDYF
ncbi:MAG: transcriptional repressor LexA [Cyanobacteria bacterium P01_F01_bin.86]